MSFLEEALAANEEYCARFDCGTLPVPPARRAAVLVCMDARLDPNKFLGTREGDIHVIRNAGGRASEDAIRSLIVSNRLLCTREFLVIHHTECGMATFTNEELQARLTAETGADASGIDFMPYRDDEDSVREDVARIRACPFIPADVPITGFLYDVRAGRLCKVAEA
jgi:carbonic anhydrase